MKKKSNSEIALALGFILGAMATYVGLRATLPVPVAAVPVAAIAAPAVAPHPPVTGPQPAESEGRQHPPAPATETNPQAGREVRAEEISPEGFRILNEPPPQIRRALARSAGSGEFREVSSISELPAPIRERMRVEGLISGD
jgi:hypothetical protein